MKFIAIKTEDGTIKGKLAFCAAALRHTPRPERRLAFLLVAVPEQFQKAGAVQAGGVPFAFCTADLVLIPVGDCLKKLLAPLARQVSVLLPAPRRLRTAAADFLLFFFQNLVHPARLRHHTF